MKNALIFILIMGVVLANSSLNTTNQSGNQYGAASFFLQNNSSNLSSVMLKIQAEIVTNTTTPAEFQSYLQQHTLVIVGNNIDLGESLLLESIKTSNLWIQNAKEINDSPDAKNEIDSGKYQLIILAGGPQQNNITQIAQSLGWLNDTNNIEAGFIVQDGKNSNGTIILSISDHQGYQNELEPQSVNYSPLSAVVPKEYVPAAATLISVILLSLVNIAWNVASFKAADIGRKGKKVGEGEWFVKGFNVSEAVAIIAASVILGIAISWQYFGPSTDLAKWLVINSVVCLFAALMHEIAHMVFARIFNIKIEYRLWPAGSVLTLLSAYLGNTFSVQGFILEEIPADIPKWKVGIMKLAAPVASTIIMIIFAWLNFNNPDPIYKIIYTISGLWAIVEILPFGSLDGKDIREWNNNIWFIFFILIGLSYIMVTFLL